MSGLLFLSSEDFNVQQGNKGNILCHNIPGFSLILFYSTHCVHCKDLIPIFKSLPGTIGGCQFGMINISNNRKCVEMSKRCITPIKYVPYIVLFINGNPLMEYKGPSQAQTLRKFVMDVANNIQQKQKFSKDIVKQNKSSSIPSYCIGIPLCGDGEVCYLTSETAYAN